uniref:uncharacterized protein LOC122599467 n=1 Tax=Erigeron canadensis TaxID=72917 RepID=UPI001CB95419|nr:uncharacterized protein LOC122599467 [Erigeron canadensis]
MMHEKSEIDSNSVGGCTSTSSASPKCNYIVQSPSRDSHDDKSSTNSTRTTPTESPSQYSSQSRMSSESRVSGPYRFSVIGKHSHQLFRKKYKWPLFSVIDEGNEDYEDGGYLDYYNEKRFMRQLRILLFLMGFVMVFTAICFITWGASRPYKFHIQMKGSSKQSENLPFEGSLYNLITRSSHRLDAKKLEMGCQIQWQSQVEAKSWKVNTFYYGEGSDTTGVPTKFLTVNCTVKMNIENPATFFGIHVSSSALNLFYSQVIVGRGQFVSYYQPKKSQRMILVNVEGQKIPLYGAGMSLIMSDNNRGVPLKLEFEIRSKANLMGQLVKTKHRSRVLCTMEIDSDNNKVIEFKKNSCSYS